MRRYYEWMRTQRSHLIQDHRTSLTLTHQLTSSSIRSVTTTDIIRSVPSSIINDQSYVIRSEFHIDPNAIDHALL
jgi:hypothetical protein